MIRESNMKITKMFWGNYYKMPQLLREITTLAALIALCVWNPPSAILLLVVWLFVGMAVWSLYYKARW